MTSEVNVELDKLTDEINELEKELESCEVTEEADASHMLEEFTETNQEQLQQINELSGMLSSLQQWVQQKESIEMTLRQELENVSNALQEQDMKYEAALEKMMSQIRIAEDVHHEQISKLQLQLQAAEEVAQQLRAEMKELRKQAHCSSLQKPSSAKWYCIGSG